MAMKGSAPGDRRVAPGDGDPHCTPNNFELRKDLDRDAIALARNTKANSFRLYAAVVTSLQQSTSPGFAEYLSRETLLCDPDYMHGQVAEGVVERFVDEIRNHDPLKPESSDDPGVEDPL